MTTRDQNLRLSQLAIVLGPMADNGSLSSGLCRFRPLSLSFQAQSEHIVQTTQEGAGHHTDLRIIDHYKGSDSSVAHAQMIFDTLFAMDVEGRPQPQMVGEFSVSEDTTEYTFTLRDDLAFTDGDPVTSEDVIAWVRRWAALTFPGGSSPIEPDGYEVVDDTTFIIRMTEPFALLPDALGSPFAPAFIMRAEDLEISNDEFIESFVGSGPFIFAEAEWIPGASAVYLRNDDYVPRDEPVSGFAGGRVVNFDRVVWTTRRTLNAQPKCWRPRDLTANRSPFSWRPTARRSSMEVRSSPPSFKAVPGLNVDPAIMDWGALTMRRASRDAPGEGGWSIFMTAGTTASQTNPLFHFDARMCDAGCFGWPCNQETEDMPLAWAAIEDFDERRAAALGLQDRWATDLPFIPFGTVANRTLYREDAITNVPEVAIRSPYWVSNRCNDVTRFRELPAGAGSGRRWPRASLEKSRRHRPDNCRLGSVVPVKHEGLEMHGGLELSEVNPALGKSVHGFQNQGANRIRARGFSGDPRPYPAGLEHLGDLLANTVARRQRNEVLSIQMLGPDDVQMLQLAIGRQRANAVDVAEGLMKHIGHVDFLGGEADIHLPRRHGRVDFVARLDNDCHCDLGMLVMEEPDRPRHERRSKRRET